MLLPSMIDNFVDERLLTMLDKRNEGIVATVYSRYTEQVKLDFDKHNKRQRSKVKGRRTKVESREVIELKIEN